MVPAQPSERVPPVDSYLVGIGAFVVVGLAVVEGIVFFGIAVLVVESVAAVVDVGEETVAVGYAPGELAV